MAETIYVTTTQPCLFRSPRSEHFNDDQYNTLVAYFTNHQALSSVYLRRQSILNLLDRYDFTPLQQIHFTQAIKDFHTQIMQQPITVPEKKHHLHKLCDAYFMYEKKESSLGKAMFNSLFKSWIKFNKENKRELKDAITELYSTPTPTEEEQQQSTAACAA